MTEARFGPGTSGDRLGLRPRLHKLCLEVFAQNAAAIATWA